MRKIRLKKSNPVKAFLLNFIFPPQCANCGDILRIKLTEKPKTSLCEACRVLWEKEKAGFCSVCGFDMKNCICIPKALERAGCTSLLKLVLYKPNGNMPVKTFMMSLKDVYYKNSFDFVAEQMKFLLIGEMRKRKLEPKDCVICYLPRSFVNETDKGFDQAKEIALSLASQTGISFSKAIKRKLFTKEEKNLNRIERSLNMNSAFYIKDKNGDIKNKTVILVDDIVTSGSSMAAATRLCYSAGAFEVFGICVGYTDKKDKKQI